MIANGVDQDRYGEGLIPDRRLGRFHRLEGVIECTEEGGGPVSTVHERCSSQARVVWPGADLAAGHVPCIYERPQVDV